MARKQVLVKDIVGAQFIADRFDVRVQMVYQWHERGTDGFDKLRLETVDDLAVYAWPDVETWGIKTGRLTVDGQPMKRRPGRRSSKS